VIVRFCLATIMLGALAGGVSAAVPTRTCHLPGVEEPLQCATVSVPLDDHAPALGTIKLHVTVAPAFREGGRPDPLFILAGGPGQAGSDVLSLVNTAFRRIRATRDIVFIDQRGTGLSGKLDCEPATGEESMTEQQLEALLLACIKQSKAPFRAYGTAAAAADIERVRSALGYRRINLWGGSYGTRLGQAYARAYPDQLRSLILDGVAAPDQIIPAGGRDGRTALEALFRQCETEPTCKSAYPQLRTEFDALSARVNGGKVVVNIADPRTSLPVSLPMTSARFFGTVHSILYSPADSRRLPYLIHNAWQGRWEPFMARRNVAADFASEGSAAMLLHFAVICAEDMPRLTPALRADDASALVAPMLDRLPAICKAVNVAPVAALAPATINVPTLMLSGALDPVTPPRRAEAAKRFIPAAQHLVVANAGHGISQLGCAPRLLREFIDQPTLPVAASCLKDIPVPGFQLGSAGPQP
jgi:pimeloyl-ACP methyl ester carboxylesterase